MDTELSQQSNTIDDEFENCISRKCCDALQSLSLIIGDGLGELSILYVNQLL